MAWQLNQPGVTLNEPNYTLNGSLVAVIKKYYTGFFHTTKALLTRGIGF